MKPMLNSGKSAIWAGVLGIVLLLATPSGAGADQGKWWTPKETKARVRSEAPRTPSQDFGLRPGDHRAWRTSPRYGRVYRDYVVINGAWTTPRAYRAQRFWVSPVYRGRLVYLRPVRYYVSATAVIGGVRISALLYPHDHWLYGCNFCDAQFEDYAHWAAHVQTCPYHPHGYSVRALDWQEDWEMYTADRGWTLGG
jgi:hypothetical protein